MRQNNVKWDAADLEARLCRAMDIAKRAVEFFAVDGYADEEVPENSFRPEKPIAECAMLIYAASAAGRLPNVARRIDQIARLLVPHARSQRTRLNIALHPSLCIDYSVPHVLLTKLGYHDASFDELMQSCFNSQARHAHERPAFASVEQKWITCLWSGAVPGRDWQPALSKSVFNQPLDLLGGLRQDSYAFTHLMMYCTDMGFRPGIFPRRRSVILAEAQSLLAKCLDEEDYDLAAEVLLAWPLTGARWSAAANFGFRVLARVEDQVGILPAGTTRADRLKKLEGNERTQYALGTAYHTALVMGLICAASLRPDKAPSTKTSGTRPGKPFLDKLLPLLDQDQGHWQPEFAALTYSEQSALAPLLLDIAISQKCRKHDYEAVSKLLIAASACGMATSTMCGQAAELLERLTVCAHAIPRAAAS